MFSCLLKVSRQIREQLTARSSGYYIILDDVSITHLAFSDEFTHAIEHKQVAQQEAERAKFIVERAEQVRHRETDEQQLLLILQQLRITTKQKSRSSN